MEITPTIGYVMYTREIFIARRRTRRQFLYSHFCGHSESRLTYTSRVNMFLKLVDSVHGFHVGRTIGGGKILLTAQHEADVRHLHILP